MKIIAWNVNGIRAMLKKNNLVKLINDEDPDIICLGETKISCPYNDVKDSLNKSLNKKYHNYWSACKIKAGYSGTAIFSKKEPINVIYGLNVNNKEEFEDAGNRHQIFLYYYAIYEYNKKIEENSKQLEEANIIKTNSSSLLFNISSLTLITAALSYCFLAAL
jgi:exodeoxyribonuclease-3